MFDISWSELLILGIVTLIFVGPKELPRFLGTLGRYAGVVRRQANEFRAVFEQAMREAELDQIQKEVRGVGDSVKASLDDATRTIGNATAAAKVDLDAKVETAAAALPDGATPTQPALHSPASAVEPPPVAADGDLSQNAEPVAAEAADVKSTTAGPA